MWNVQISLYTVWILKSRKMKKFTKTSPLMTGQVRWTHSTSEPCNGFTIKYNMKASHEHHVQARKSYEIQSLIICFKVLWKQEKLQINSNPVWAWCATVGIWNSRNFYEDLRTFLPQLMIPLCACSCCPAPQLIWPFGKICILQTCRL